MRIGPGPLGVGAFRAARVLIYLGVALPAATVLAQDAPANATNQAPQTNPGAAAEPTPAATQDADADASAATLLSRAEDAITSIEYQRSRALAERAIARGGLGIDELTRAYRLVAVSSAQVDDTESAERAFLRLFALEPQSNVATRLSPTRRTAVLNARGFWSVRKNGFGLDVSYARRDRQVVVRVRDPIKWARTVHVWSRFGDRPFTKAERPAEAEVVIGVPDIAMTDALDVYAFAVDDYGNVMMQFGRERDPHVFGLSDEEFAAIVRRDIRGGQTGSYARRLEELGVQVGVHGYASLEFKRQDAAKTFDVHHATAMIRANLLRAVSLEIALEWEHLGTEEDGFYLPHAFLDIMFNEMLILRGGFFEAPVSAFNEYLYPDFLRITGLPPIFSRSVIPALWSEVGVQLRGRFKLAATTHLTYAAFISNGLQQPDGMPGDGMIAEGGDIRSMTFNARDTYSSNKAVGGRLGLEIEALDVGVAGYTGRYTIDGARQLSMADADLSFRNAFLTVRAEGAVAFQEVVDGRLKKYGGYLLIAGRPIPYLEPYAQYDRVDLGTQPVPECPNPTLDTSCHRGLVGMAIYPFPLAKETRNLRLKSEAGYAFTNFGHRAFVWFFQLTTGF